jgi:hypothetical protein
MFRKLFSSKFSKNLHQLRNYSDKQWNIKMSEFSAVTINPIRSMWERYQPKGNKNKSEIHLQPGDPTLSGKIQDQV